MGGDLAEVRRQLRQQWADPAKRDRIRAIATDPANLRVHPEQTEALAQIIAELEAETRPTANPAPTTDRDQQIVAAVLAGEPCAAVAARYALSAGHVRRLTAEARREAGIAQAAQPRPALRIVPNEPGSQPDAEPPSQWWREWPDLDDLPTPEPLIATEEGQTLIPDRGLTSFYGPMASGKSWAALGAAAVVAINGGRAVLVDTEMGIVPTARRLRPLCGGPPDGLRYAARASTAELVEWLTEADKRLVVIDTIGGLGGHSNHAAEYVEWHQRHIQPLIDADIAVLTVDHDLRSKAGHKDRAQHGALGTAAKGNLADLVYQVVGASWTGTLGGSASLILRKDRHGIHQQPADTVVAKIHVGYDNHDGMTFEFRDATGGDPTGATGPSERVADRIRNDITFALIAAGPAGLSAASLEREVKGKAAHIRHVRDAMVDEETLSRTPDGRYITT